MRAILLVAEEGLQAQCVLHYCIKRDETGGLEQQRRRLAARVVDPSVSLRFASGEPGLATTVL